MPVRPNVRLAVMLAAVSIVLGCASRGPRVEPAFPIPCIWPTPSAARTVTSEFGVIRSAGGRGSRRHQGIDIGAPKGWPVFATADGVVSRVDRDRRGYGRYVVLSHANGYSTLYAHLSKVRVKQGARVRAGETIGAIGRTGRATGYHLHYEVRRNGQPVNPRAYLPAR